ncbi:MAG: aminopeptidase [Gammaproteobacteria bacterium]|nr:aminopeptidase [Gammaproteobacteria bacterium]
MDVRGGLPFLLALLLSGCSTVGYYGQAVGGHLDILLKQQPIEDLLQQADLDPNVAEKLRLSQQIREFAKAQLGLPDSGSYQRYADIGRDYVTWNVVATPATSLTPLQHCFLVVGCLNYRGFFAEAAADAAAAQLRQQGYDVMVSGATAYSTLGWFADPLLNTLLRGDSSRLIEVMLHELAHQRLYIKGDSAFNEAFASAVAEAGVARWWQQAGDRQAAENYQQQLQRRHEFNQLLRRSREQLTLLYQQLPQAVLREKAAIFTALKADYQVLKAQWGGYRGYDRWFSADLNNAHLAQVATYHDLVPFFRAVIAASATMESFYEQMAALAELSQDERRSRLQQLAATT